MSAEIGTRIGAILSTDNDQVEFLGYGVLDGFEAPAGIIPELARFVGDPRLKLDDGTVVYGSECWWGEEKEIQKFLENKEVIPVSLPTQ